MADPAYEHSGPAAVTLFRTAVGSGARVEGVASGLAGVTSPLTLRYTCEERCIKMYFPDQKEVATAGRNMPAFCSRVVASAEVALVQEQSGFASFAFDAPADAPPNFIGVHDCMDHTLVYSCAHTVSVLAADGACYGSATVNVVPDAARRPGAAEDETSHMDRDIRVLPRICWRCDSRLARSLRPFEMRGPNRKRTGALHAARAVHGRVHRGRRRNAPICAVMRGRTRTRACSAPARRVV